MVGSGVKPCPNRQRATTTRTLTGSAITRWPKKTLDEMMEAVPDGTCATGAIFQLWWLTTMVLVWRGWTLGEMTRNLVAAVDSAEEEPEPPEFAESPHAPGHA